jgi:serine/threonine-protein kinase
MSGSEEAAALQALSADALPSSEDSVRPERTEPERVGRYELCFELASGGMATVYLARVAGASGFEKLVALKRIHRHLAKDQKYVEMFLDEAKIASRITHPNVCSVFDFGQSDGEYYIAMEYLMGEPLSRLCGRVARNQDQRRHPLLPLRMAGIVADACEGLHAAHELKDANGDLMHVIHRDVSPRNLFVTYDGSVQVVDFGIASARQRMHHTATGQVKGTFAYMAPEQLTSNPTNRRVDIWSLGVALWEMTTLKRLFRRDTTANTVHAVLYDEIEPPSALRSQVPAELDEIVMKALQRAPEDRWQTTREMGRALRQFLGTRQDVMGPAELSEWMSEIFPQGEARKSQLMEIARMAKEAVPVIPRAGELDLTLTASQVLVAQAPAQRKAPRWWARKPVAALGLGALGVAIATSVALSGAEPQLDEPSALVPVVEPVPSPEASAPATAIAEVAEVAEQPAPTAPERPTASAPVRATPVAAEPRTTRRARRNEAVPSGPGTVNIVTRGGWAEVYKGKKLLGSTPRRLTLPAGRHKLVLKPFGDGKPKTVSVRVVAGETRNVSIPLE